MTKLISVALQKGLVYAAKASLYYGTKTILNFAMSPYYTRFIKPKYFTLNNKKYRYFYHRYNATWHSERSVEIAIIKDYLAIFKNNAKVLELGNVLNHYLDIDHTVIDKYEKARGVTNMDIVDFKEKSRYDVVISISTLEHVGYDETPHEPRKFIKAIDKLVDAAKPKGEVIITIPVGYNKHLDNYIKSNKISNAKYNYMQKVSDKDKIWREVDHARAFSTAYNFPFPGVNSICIIRIIKA